MSEAVTRRAAQPADEGQTRRAERGVVAAYIHELSQRHEDERVREPGPDPALDGSEGA